MNAKHWTHAEIFGLLADREMVRVTLDPDDSAPWMGDTKRRVSGPGQVTYDRVNGDVRTTPPSSGLANNKRAETQRRIADAIRTEGGPADETLAEIERSIIDGTAGPRAFADLFAAAHDDTIWDALAQVRQAIVLERGGGPELRPFTVMIGSSSPVIRHGRDRHAVAREVAAEQGPGYDTPADYGEVTVVHDARGRTIIVRAWSGL